MKRLNRDIEVVKEHVEELQEELKEKNAEIVKLKETIDDQEEAASALYPE